MTPARARGTRLAGSSAPLGATLVPGGVNFSIYSRDATAMELLLFDCEDAGPARVIALEPAVNRSYHYWHKFVPDLAAGQFYAYRAHGPFDPSRGLRFDPAKVLLDPYARGVTIPREYSRELMKQPGDHAATAMKSVVVDTHGYDWEGDCILRRPASETIIYEMHVRGFTVHPSSGVSQALRGTYAGAVEKIPYLRDLGITAVELMPVFQFDAQDGPPGLTNYWGYSPVGFFAPHVAYSSRRDPRSAIREFRDMVKAFHRAGIEVILDVVFNHTAEDDDNGPTFCFRGLDNRTYYILQPDSRYANYTGTGNTLKANHPVVRRLILDSLRYWVEEMHVDGFRFDLASVLDRDESGMPMLNPPVLWDIESEPALAGVKLIAEAWDAGGLYQVGSFVGDSWREWNGRFRDDVRSFLRCDRGFARAFGNRLLGSPEIYSHEQREVEQSVNFVTCHDGFTLNDLVSYNSKHNEANGENNRDGTDDNRSWNSGTEGPSEDAAIEQLRNREVKNFLAVTILSAGLPMILMGDELRRTQQGNNNAYCQDGPVSWLDWTLAATHADLLRFVSLLNAHRRSDTPAAHWTFHGIKVGQPDWSDYSHSLALTSEDAAGQPLRHFIVNAYWESLTFDLPPLGIGARWRLWIDTSLDPPHEIVEPEDAVSVSTVTYAAGPRSVVVLIAGR